MWGINFNSFGKSFVLILYSGFSAGSIIRQLRKDIVSKIIISCSVSRVSGVFRHLVEAGSLNFQNAEKTLLCRPRDNLVAIIANKPKYTQVLITNACQLYGLPVLEPPLSFSHGRGIYGQEMVAHFNWPAPSTNETDSRDIYHLSYVRRATGVDLTAPLDSDNYVSGNHCLLCQPQL